MATGGAATAGGAAAAGAGLPAATVVHCDMPSAQKDFAIKKAQEALAAAKVEKDQAQYVKKALEENYGGVWHVVVGTSFGMSVSHDNHCLVVFKIGKTHFLAFQSFDDASLVRKAGADADAGARGHGHAGVKESKKADEDEDDA